MRLYCLLLTASCLFPSLSFSQQYLVLEKERNYVAERSQDSNAKFHSSIKPFLWEPAQQSKAPSAVDSTNKIASEKTANIPASKKQLNFCGTPLLNLEAGYDLKNHQTSFQSSIGFMGGGNIFTPKLYYSLNFLAAVSSFPAYIDTFIKRTGVIPGLGKAHGTDNAYSYQYYSGYLSYSPNKIFNFQFGKDKNFLGDGYRSMFLSDVSNSYPFLKISTTLWKIKYVCLFAEFKDITAASGMKNDFKNKFGSFHYLSWNVTKRFNLGLFESVIWQGADENRSRSFDVSYLNPIIFYRPVEYSLGSSDNVLMGISFKEKVAKKQQFYGQFMIDEFLLKEMGADIFHDIFPNTKHHWGWWGNKYGLQLGFKSFDLFTLRNLFFQTEINYARPFTYTHGSVQQNYANYNQPLAHPLGADFAESVSFLHYRYKRWTFETEFLYAVYGKDSVGGRNLGNNIFLSYTAQKKEYGNYLAQGIKTNLHYMQVKLSYCLIPSSDLMAEAGVAVRQERNSTSSFNSNFFFIGIKTGITNHYSDF
ncbi:MAG: hypothetical protein HY840_08015 [Bacteroidetes bacterium]|nr:hypothetical protein [Bacteroidota bacterium]